MEACCSDKSHALDKLRERQSSTLRIVLAINAVMFVVEFASGVVAGSLALLADSLDMLGDALVYGFSLYVVGLGLVWKMRAARIKAAVMAAFGLLVLGQIVYRLIHPGLPSAETMSVVAVVALVANGICFALLVRHRSEDINMRSVWLCSRNDLVANVAVLIAAVGVALAASPWPDVVAGALICALFLRSSWVVAREARLVPA
ncbi:MAG TPA: cation transporter [Casimicrobiaceae bacterium]|nr:cation transporter [Casimicrobiaceae bacterium]